MPIQVNYYDKVIYITSPTTTVTVQELVDAIRAAEDTPEGMAFGGSVATLTDAVTDAEGKASVGGGFLSGIVMTLKSDWYIEFWDGVVLGTVSGGNVTGGLAGRPVRCEVGSSDTALQLGAVGGVIAETGVSGLTSEESTELFSIKSDIKGADDDDLKDISDQIDAVPTASEVGDEVWNRDLTAHTTKGSAGATQQCQLYDNAVVIDVANGEAGTGWPVGTHRYPSNNLTDTLAIAVARSLDTILVHGPITIGATDTIDGYTFIGHEGWGPKVTFTAGCSANETSFKYMELEGELSVGDTLLVESCTISNSLINFNGVMNIVNFAQGSEVSVDTWANIIQGSAGGDPANEPELVLNGAAVTVTHYSGNLKVKGKSASNRTTLGLAGGNLIIDSTCIAGTIQLLGHGYLEADNSGPSCTVDQEGFLSRMGVSDQVWDEDLSTHLTKGSASEALQIDRSVSIDTVLGEAGTAWPIGTHRYPVNNLADALTIAAARNIDELFIHGTLTIGATDNVDGYQFIGHEGWGANIIFTAGCSANDTSWKYLELNGEVLSGNVMLIESCTVGTLTNFRGVMNIVAFTQSADITIDGWATILEAQAGGDPASEPEISVGTALVTISKYTGNLKIMDKTGSNRITVGCTGGNIVIDSTCVNGTIQLLGNGHLEADNSGPGCSVDTDGFLSMATIDTAITTAETNVRGADGDDLKTISDQIDTLETLVAFIRDIEGGRWKIENNQMIFYKDDNVTEVARFNLYDADGTPAETDVFERERV